MISLIEKLGLQDLFIPTYKDCKTYKATAEKLSKISGTNLSLDCIRRYHKGLEQVANTEISNEEVSTAKVAKEWVNDKAQVLGAYQQIVDAAKSVLESAKTDQEKLAAVPVALKSLERAMNMHNIGVVKNNQNINVIQMNFMKEKATEFAKIIMEEFNGQSDEIISVIQRRLLVNGGQ